jgi:hypothetical protein
MHECVDADCSLQALTAMEYALSTEEYHRFRRLIYDKSGIALGDRKQSLVRSRLSKRLRDLQLATFSEYYDFVMSDPNGEEFTRLLDLISTNKTDFFREPKHFDFLRDMVLPELAGEKRIRIWSSACSTGSNMRRIPTGGISGYLLRIFQPEYWPRRRPVCTMKTAFAVCRKRSSSGTFSEAEETIWDSSK